MNIFRVAQIIDGVAAALCFLAALASYWIGNTALAWTLLASGILSLWFVRLQPLKRVVNIFRAKGVVTGGRAPSK